MRFFRKIGKFTVFGIKLTIKSNNLGRKIRKIGFFAKISMNFRKLFLQIIACGYILAQLLKNHFPRKIKVGISQNPNPTKIPTSYCRKNQKFDKFVILHNRIQISEKFSPIISKLAFFSQVPQQLFNKQV